MFRSRQEKLHRREAEVKAEAGRAHGWARKGRPRSGRGGVMDDGGLEG